MARFTKPDGVIVDGVDVGHWPAKEPTDPMAWLVDVLPTCHATYVAEMAWLNFYETPLDRVRRIASAFIGARDLNLQDVMTAYLRAHGMPSEPGVTI